MLQDKKGSSAREQDAHTAKTLHTTNSPVKFLSYPLLHICPQPQIEYGLTLSGTKQNFLNIY